MRTLIWGGTIVDGSGKPGYPGGLLTDGDKIVQILPAGPGHRDMPAVPGVTASWGTGKDNAFPDGPGAASIPGTSSDLTVIDARGMVVCPGFIDTHSHSDLYCLSHPDVLPKVMQGVTTEIVGQDGLGAAPVPEELQNQWQKLLQPLDGTFPPESLGKLGRVSGYLDMVDRAKPGVNVCTLVPHGNVRMMAMGLGSEKPSQAQTVSMQEYLLRNLKDGAFGLSTGLIYPPCSYADEEELTALCQAAAKMKRKLVIHQRSEADDILDSMEEVFDICRKSGAGVHFSHFKVCGFENEKNLPKMLELLDRAEEGGIDVSFDQYPYPMGSTMLSACLPPDVMKGGMTGEMAMLQSEGGRRHIIDEIRHPDGKWDNFFSFAGPDHIFISGVKTAKNKDKVGRSLTEIARAQDVTPEEVMFRLLIDEENDVSMVDYYGTEDQVRTLLLRPEMNVCTDGLYSGHPHPRVYGTFPRILGKYVREEGLLPLEAAVCRMTGRPASVFRIPERGLVREGYHADLVVFDPDRIRDTATFEEPVSYPEGIKAVLVNGIPEVQDGQPTGRRGGRAVRGVQ